MNGIYLYFVTNTFLVGRCWDFNLIDDTMDQIIEDVFDTVENMDGKGENTDYQNFYLST